MQDADEELRLELVCGENLKALLDASAFMPNAIVLAKCFITFISRGSEGPYFFTYLKYVTSRC